MNVQEVLRENISIRLTHQEGVSLWRLLNQLPAAVIVELNSAD